MGDEAHSPLLAHRFCSFTVDFPQELSGSTPMAATTAASQPSLFQNSQNRANLFFTSPAIPNHFLGLSRKRGVVRWRIMLIVPMSHWQDCRRHHLNPGLAKLHLNDSRSKPFKTRVGGIGDHSLPLCAFHSEVQRLVDPCEVRKPSSGCRSQCRPACETTTRAAEMRNQRSCPQGVQ